MLIKRIKRLSSRLGLAWHIAIFAGILMVFTLPLRNVWQALMPDRVIGVDGAFFASLILVPLLVGAILYIFAKRADDLERHMRKFENE